jgi:rubredoxin
MTFAGLALACVAFASPMPANMNPTMAYTISNPAPGQEGISRKFTSTNFFEVDSAVMKMKYSEVCWRTLPGVPLPADIRAKYANSSMAVVGFEVDVLRRNPATNKTESVPAYQSYNHHYGVQLHSSAVKLRTDANGQPTGADMGHGKLLEYDLVPGVRAPPAGARLAQSFVHGNGQEHRQMFHGAPPGFAQPLFAPGTFYVTPMQISTNDGTGRRGAGGPLPAIKRAGGLTPADPAAKYSPLLECPCTTRMHKVLKPDGSGTINGHGYDGDCGRAEPVSDLNATRNPTCKASWYVGGLTCCPDKGLLLDQDQTPPAFVDETFFRFRFYYEDYHPARQQAIDHLEWAANGCDSGCGGKCPNNCRHIEFDVVEGAGSAAGPDVQTFQSTFKAGDMLASSCTATSAQCFDGRSVAAGPGGAFKLVMAASHCHAPNCIRQELVNKDTGEVICNGTTQLGLTEDNYDEAGYLFTPPCLWGSPADGLQTPPILTRNTTMQMITYFNSTYGHPGQMGIWQMKGAPVVVAPPTPPPAPSPGPGPAAASWACSVCAHVYEPATDAAPSPAGTAFEDLPDSWKCPVCGASKSAYRKQQASGGSGAVWVHVHEHKARE